MKYYLDSCIWLNLLKKEGDASKGKPYWKIAEDFISRVMFSEDEEILYSDFVLKEIEVKLENKKLFEERKAFLEEEMKFISIKAAERDYAFARKLESKLMYELSFYDCMHIAICKRLDLILVTRDKDLIKFAKKFVIVKRPENLII